MGQKTHPKAFRLVSTQPHLSSWYAEKKKYSVFLQEDFQIREVIMKELEKILEISSIQIERLGNKVNLLLTVLYPRQIMLKTRVKKFFEKQLSDPKYRKFSIKEWTSFFLKQKLRSLSQKLNKLSENIYFISLKFLKNRYLDASLIANFISFQLADRLPFRRILKTVLTKAKKSGVKGIKIELSGRLNGIDIARSEWKRQGKIPLHTLRAFIDYSHKISKGPQGITGIKVWVYN